MPDKKTVETLVELKNDIRDFQHDEPYRWPDEEVDKDVPDGTRIDLDRTSKPWELLEALGTTRSEIGLTLEKVYALIEELVDEIDRLKNHRHDHSKAYTGRPEL